MKRMRLLKPWGLRTVRQRLENFSGNEFAKPTPCSGPGSIHSDHPIALAHTRDLRKAKATNRVHDLRSRTPVKLPPSGHA